MTEKELTNYLSELKQIKPSREWVVLSKVKILGSDVSVRKEITGPAPVLILSNIMMLLSRGKLAYSFAVLLFVFAGVIGVMGYKILNDQNVAANHILVAENTLKTNLEELKTNVTILADSVKENPKNSELALTQVKVAAKKLTEGLQKNPELVRAIALDVNNNNTLLDLVGGQVNEVKDMYKAMVDSLLNDLHERTLNEEKQKELKRIEDNYNNGGDSGVALRDILLMNAAKSDKAN